MSTAGASRARLLAEMGIKPLWRLRDAAAADDALPETIATEAVAQLPPGPVQHASSMLTALPATEPAGPHASVRSPAVADDTRGWEDLAQAVKDCRACGLCAQRKQTVFGVGDRHAEWMFIGEGPGAEEDERGEPFVGQAGKLLDAMLASVGMKRGDNVYIANAVKCRPPGNRTPEPAEMAACHPFLRRQVALIRPKLIVAMGRPAAQTLLDAEVRISASRGRTFDYHGIPVIVTYHPAYLLRNLHDKAKAWEDLCFAQDTMAQLRETAHG